jgi:hypothetical protein
MKNAYRPFVQYSVGRNALLVYKDQEQLTGKFILIKNQPGTQFLNTQ